MSEKLPPLSIIKELAAEKGVELPDDIIDAVAGGAYTEEEWFKMTTEERQAAQITSMLNKLVYKLPCDLD